MCACVEEKSIIMRGRLIATSPLLVDERGQGREEPRCKLTYVPKRWQLLIEKFFLLTCNEQRQETWCTMVIKSLAGRKRDGTRAIRGADEDGRGLKSGICCNLNNCAADKFKILQSYLLVGNKARDYYSRRLSLLARRPELQHTSRRAPILPPTKTPGQLSVVLRFEGVILRLRAQPPLQSQRRYSPRCF